MKTAAALLPALIALNAAPIGIAAAEPALVLEGGCLVTFATPDCAFGCLKGTVVVVAGYGMFGASASGSCGGSVASCDVTTNPMGTCGDAGDAVEEDAVGSCSLSVGAHQMLWAVCGT